MVRTGAYDSPGGGSASGSGTPRDYEEYVSAIAEARYTIRKVQRIIDEQARSVGLDPLEHQALLQIYAAEGSMLSVSRLSDRLDVPVEVASRLAKQLDEAGLLSRRRADHDRRVTEVRVTADGQRKVHQILREVIPHVQGFADELEDESKLRSLMTFAFYLGIDLSPDRLRPIVEDREQTLLWPTRR